MPRGGPSPRLSGGDGAAESVFPGGVASMTWTQRVLEGVTETRDPAQAQSARPEPRVARSLGARLLGPLLAPLMQRLLLERSESLQPLWAKARLEGLLLEDVLQTSARTEPALGVQRVV